LKSRNTKGFAGSELNADYGRGIEKIKHLIFALIFAPALALPLRAGEAAEPAPAVHYVRADEQDAPPEQPFERPLRGIQTTPPLRILEQQQDRLRFPVIPEIYGLEKPLTESYIKRYSSPSGLKWISSVMKNGDPYLSFIRGEIERRGLPRDLLYLPVVESGFTVTAKSSSGAAGLWQFMRNSVKPYMVITEHIDERMDFWKSTQGALSKLEDNYGNYNDWALSLAAYNSGSGEINRVIKQTGIKDYWILAEKTHLKNESIHYVPKLLAACYIVSNPRKFGLDILWKPSRTVWVRLPVGREADIRLLAEYAGVNKDELLKMNSELRGYTTPPPAAGYLLKVKKTDAESLLAVLENKDLKLIKHYAHTIRSGDTLSVLAGHYGVSVRQIIEMNPGINPNSLQIGASISIPAINDIAPYTGNAGGKTGAEREMPAPRLNGVWTVRKGDTLWSIARQYGISHDELANGNGINITDTLSIGQKLKVPEL
jgi:membrane-bound lytic murein transglycosylase D